MLLLFHDDVSLDKLLKDELQLVLPFVTFDIVKSLSKSPYISDISISVSFEPDNDDLLKIEKQQHTKNFKFFAW